MGILAKINVSNHFTPCLVELYRHIWSKNPPKVLNYAKCRFLGGWVENVAVCRLGSAGVVSLRSCDAAASQIVSGAARVKYFLVAGHVD